MTDRHNDRWLGMPVVSFVAGSMIGAGIALLYAPQSGDRTRQEMRERAERTIIKAQQLEDDIKETMGHLIEEIRLRVNRLIEEGKCLAEDKRKEVLADLEAGKQVLEGERNKLESRVKEI